jgi:hypothetical protein
MKKLITKIRRNVLVGIPVSQVNNFELIIDINIAESSKSAVFVHVLVCIFGRHFHHPFIPACGTVANRSNIDGQSVTDQVVSQMVRSFEIYPYLSNQLHTRRVCLNRTRVLAPQKWGHRVSFVISYVFCR